MMLWRLLVSAIPYGFVVLFAVWQSMMPSAGYFNDMARAAPREPIAATGEVWAVDLRGAGERYLTQYDFLLYWSPFIIVPGFIVAILWIMRDWYRAGLFEVFGAR